jgi:hypothetical protein
LFLVTFSLYNKKNKNNIVQNTQCHPTIETNHKVNYSIAEFSGKEGKESNLPLLWKKDIDSLLASNDYDTKVVIGRQLEDGTKVELIRWFWEKSRAGEIKDLPTLWLGDLFISLKAINSLDPDKEKWTDDEVSTACGVVEGEATRRRKEGKNVPFL